MSVTVAIHQPNFFPWLGYFAKLAAADVFVLLDDVDFPKNSWVNRVKLRVGGAARWVTCPVRRPTAGTPIRCIEIDEADDSWRRKTMTTIETNYRRAAGYDAVIAQVRELVEHDAHRLAAYNAIAIETIARTLGLGARVVRQSELLGPGAFEARGSERLAAICRELDGDTYLAGDGADAYEDLATYEQAGIAFRRLDFVHPEYDQGDPNTPFIPGLSVLDALFHLGPAGTAALLEDTTHRPAS